MDRLPSEIIDAFFNPKIMMSPVTRCLVKAVKTGQIPSFTEILYHNQVPAGQSLDRYMDRMIYQHARDNWEEASVLINELVVPQFYVLREQGVKLSQIEVLDGSMGISTLVKTSVAVKTCESLDADLTSWDFVKFWTELEVGEFDKDTAPQVFMDALGRLSDILFTKDVRVFLYYDFMHREVGSERLWQIDAHITRFWNISFTTIPDYIGLAKFFYQSMVLKNTRLIKYHYLLSSVAHLGYGATATVSLYISMASWPSITPISAELRQRLESPLAKMSCFARYFIQAIDTSEMDYGKVRLIMARNSVEPWESTDWYIRFILKEYRAVN